MTNFIDCSHEVTPPVTIPASARRWTGPEIRSGDWLVDVDEGALSEIASLARFIEHNPVQNLQRDVREFEIPRLRRCMGRMKSRLDDGVGFAVLDRLPTDEIAIDILVEIYWLLGQLVGRPVAQKWNGEMVYQVRDTGQQYTYGVRGSHTSVELVFHADNAFGMAMPEHVGLFCRNPAKSGGVSRFCCLATLHDRVQLKYPKALERLYQPMFFDRQKEHRDGGPAACLAPFFSSNGHTLQARANTSLVRKGYDVMEQSMDRQLVDALDAVDEISQHADLWFEAPLERGQIQYLNNFRTAHYRSDFVDHDEPERKRFLYRLWHRETGGVCYDGAMSGV